LADLAARIERLEQDHDDLRRENARLRRTSWRWRVAGLAGLLLGGLVLALEQVPPGHAQGTRGRTVEADQIVLRDGKRRVRASLSMTDEGPVLAFYDDTKKKPRLELGVAKSGPLVRLSDADGQSRAELGLEKQGPALVLRDDQGKLRTGLVMQGGPALVLADEKEKQRAQLKLTSEGVGLLLNDANAKPLVELKLVKDFTALILAGMKGKSGVELGVGPAGPGIVIKDETGKSAAVRPTP
jgi:hypothetical protein